MSTIIGLGKAGCNIAKELSAYPQYNVLCVDSEEHDYRKFKLIKKQSSFEDYENNFPSIKKFISGTKGPYSLVLGGSGKISGASLNLLEQIRSNDISVLYVKPESDIMSDMASKQERIVFHVLQQYARSNLLKNMFVF